MNLIKSIEEADSTLQEVLNSPSLDIQYFEKILNVKIVLFKLKMFAIDIENKVEYITKFFDDKEQK